MNINRKMKKGALKKIAFFLLVIQVCEVFFPSAVYALSSGPSQPEVQSFEPINTTELVNLTSGDFNYNIPLIDVGGYPVNISYHSGVTMDEESSWVGLGWNINPGVINRNMRGLPDDFDGSKGDKVMKRYNQKRSTTFGVTPGIGLELAEFELGKLGLNVGIDINWNNYKGLGFGLELSPSFSFNKFANASLSLNSTNAGGVSVTPSISFGSDKYGAGATLSSSFNTREGLKTLSLNYQLNFNEAEGQKDYDSNENASMDIGGSSITFGASTFIPKTEWPTRNWGVSASFKFGPGIFFSDVLVNIKGYAFWQTLGFTERNLSAYGYLNSQNANGSRDVLHDFNREKEGAFTQNTPALSLTNHTYDMYNVSGHGVGGMYRPYRGDVGMVYDPQVKEWGMDGALGVDFGAGNVIKGGVDVHANITMTSSGRWDEGNKIRPYLNFQKEKINSDFESYYFKEYGDLSVDADNNYALSYFGDQPTRVEIGRNMASKTIKANSGSARALQAPMKRNNRKKRNENVSFLTMAEAKGFGVDPALYKQNDVFTLKDHHIGEFTTLKSDGTRYVYGLPAYNKLQKEVTFATGIGQEGARSINNATGLVTYSAGADNSQGNKQGLDHYYSSNEVGAYAHSFLLTNIFSADYIDNDEVIGPSDEDMGNYTKFNYKKVAGDYKWRTPIDANTANAEVGMLSMEKDDKGSYIYGEKDVWYISSIETKNYIAVFNTSDRMDGVAVTGENGGINASAPRLQKLDNIKLYDKKQYKAAANAQAIAQLVPVKSVFFEYDYSLCPSVPNNAAIPGSGATTINASPVRDAGYQNTTAGTGKLTLKKIFFTYQNSERARFSPYKFDYNSINPSYNGKHCDRWGTFKPYVLMPGAVQQTGSAFFAAFPYTEQPADPANANQKADLDDRSHAWTLTDITLPSGGAIKVDYEADDYAYVQNKRSMQMFRILGLGNSDAPNGYRNHLYDGGKTMQYHVYIDLTKKVSSRAELYKYYLEGINNLFFNFKVNLNKPSRGQDNYEYVRAYAEIENYGVFGTPDANGNYTKAFIKVKSVDLGDSKNSRNVSPFFKSAAQFARLSAPEIAFDNPGVGDNAGVEGALRKFAGLFTNFKELITGPNGRILSDTKCQDIISEESYIRLNCPTMKKLGGGTRVKRILMQDNAANMNMGTTTSYGQSFDYTTTSDTYGQISSGVAAYEPMIGGDENPFRQPVPFNNIVKEKLLVPDDKFYMEEPFGEVFFPAAAVIYSKVSVKDIVPANVTKHATGIVVNEFYTTKDFPTKTSRTTPDIAYDSNKKKMSLLKVATKDKLVASQGFVIEVNDMNGKPKSKTVYAQPGSDGKTPVISSIKYNYLRTGDRLVNTVSVINKSGVVENKTIGVDVDVVFDSNESNVRSYSPGVHLNAETMLWPFPPVTIPAFIPLPSFTKDETQFRYITCTKVVTRIGILESTEATNLNSRIITYNRAYDSETGAVLLTEVQNEYDDAVFNLTYPAHWAYEGMGQAYKNLGMKIKLPLTELNTGYVVLNSGNTPADELATLRRTLAEGDEMYIINKEADAELKKLKFYITEIADASDGTHITIMAGDPNALTLAAKRCQMIPTGGTGLVYNFKIIRSGRRNMQSLPIASVTSLTNPIKDVAVGSGTVKQLKFLANDQILTSGAQEYSDFWKFDCKRYEDMGTPTVINPFYEGLRGNFRLAKTYTFLADRNRDTPLGLRKDGYFTFSPFWLPNGTDANWTKSSIGWRLVNSITEYDQYASQESENLDAIGRYSTGFYGYNHSRQTGVSSNAKSNQLFFDNFEDSDSRKGIELKFQKGTGATNVSHTGKKSIKVTKNTTAAEATVGGCCN